MKKILILFIIYLLGNKISFSQSQFNDSLLLSNKRNIVFVIRICQNNEENKYIFNRAYLFYSFIHRDIKMNFQYDNVYQAYIANIIRNKICITAPDTINIPTYFKKVIQNQEVDSVARFGKEVFLEYFIQENGYIKNEKHQYQYAIVNQLFEWDVVLKFDTYSGLFYIEELLRDWLIKNEKTKSQKYKK